MKFTQKQHVQYFKKIQPNFGSTMKRNLTTSILLVLLIAVIIGFVLVRYWNFNWGMSVGQTCSVFIAALAFFTTMHHTHAVRKHNELQVKPHLVFYSYCDEKFESEHITYRLAVRNVGLGPAIIEKFTLTIDGKILNETDSFHDEFHALIFKKFPIITEGYVQTMRFSKDDAIDKGIESIIIQTSIPRKDFDLTASHTIFKK